MEKMSSIVRRQFKEGDDIRDAGLTTPEDVIRYDDIAYGKDSEMQVLDVYRPKDAEGRILPVIVSVHGGGWVYGDKERYQYYCMSLAQRGFAVVNFSYRLAPEHQFPASLKDTNLAFAWVLKHKDEYGMDMENLFAVGDSAGAQMLSMYADICTNEEYAANCEIQIPDGIHIKAVALNSGQYSLENPENMTKQLMAEYLPGKGTAEELKHLSPVLYVNEKFPPAYIMTAEEDFLRAQAPVMYEKLKEKGVACELHDYSSDKEKLQHVFHLNMKSEAAKRCNDEECDFFRRLTIGDGEKRFTVHMKEILCYTERKR